MAGKDVNTKEKNRSARKPASSKVAISTDEKVSIDGVKTVVDKKENKPGIVDVLLSKGAKVIRAYLSMRATDIGQETKNFMHGILGWLVLTLASGAVLFSFWLLAGVFAVISLHDYASLSYPMSVLIIAAGNIALAFVMLISARKMSKKNFFPLTRKFLRDVAKIFA